MNDWMNKQMILKKMHVENNEPKKNKKTK